MATSEKNLADKIAVGRVITKKLTLTNAQLKALATGFTLVDGIANKTLRFVGASFYLQAGTNPLTENGDNLVVNYKNAGGVAVSDIIEMTGFIDAAVNMNTCAVPIKNPIVTSGNSLSQPLVLWNAGVDFAGNAANDAKLVVIVSYIVDNPKA